MKLEAFNNLIEECKTTHSYKHCWLWKKGVDSRGHPKMMQGRKQVRPNRVAYNIHFNTTLVPQQRLSKVCNNRKCFNPQHQEVIKRSATTKAGANSKSTGKAMDNELRNILIKIGYALGYSQTSLAAVFKLSQPYINIILKRHHE